MHCLFDAFGVEPSLCRKRGGREARKGYTATTQVAQARVHAPPRFITSPMKKPAEAFRPPRIFSTTSGLAAIDTAMASSSAWEGGYRDGGKGAEDQSASRGQKSRRPSRAHIGIGNQLQVELLRHLPRRTAAASGISLRQLGQQLQMGRNGVAAKHLKGWWKKRTLHASSAPARHPGQTPGHCPPW